MHRVVWVSLIFLAARPVQAEDTPSSQPATSAEEPLAPDLYPAAPELDPLAPDSYPVPPIPVAPASQPGTLRA